jgi:apolipoprotein N-acyltransferase
MRQITPFIWLAIGGVCETLCLGKGTIPPAAWLVPIFLLHFARITPPIAGLLSIWLVLLAAAAVSNRGVIPLSGFAYFGVVSMIAIAITGSYVADRLLASRFAGIASTLIFPLACVAVEFINTITGPFGSWGAVAYTQYDNLPLMQLVSVTGIFGISFLIAWFASVVNWAWDHDFAWHAIRGGVLLYAGVFSLMMLAGATRLRAWRVRREIDPRSSHQRAPGNVQSGGRNSHSSWRSSRRRTPTVPQGVRMPSRLVF